MKRVNKGHKRAGISTLREINRNREIVRDLKTHHGEARPVQHADMAIKRPVKYDDFLIPVSELVRSHRRNDYKVNQVSLLGVSIVGNSVCRYIRSNFGRLDLQMRGTFEEYVSEHNEDKEVYITRFKLNGVRTKRTGGNYYYVVGVFDRESEIDIKSETNAVFDRLGIGLNDYTFNRPHLTITGHNDRHKASGLVEEFNEYLIDGTIPRIVSLGATCLYYSDPSNSITSNY